MMAVATLLPVLQAGQVILPAPDALPLPAPVWLLGTLLLLTFLLHVVAMNAMLGGLILTLFARLSAGGPGEPIVSVADAVAKVSPTLIAATVTLGVAPLLFLQILFGQYLFTSSILMGWSWFSLVPVLIVAYYGAYLQAFRGPGLGRLRTPLLAVTSLLFLWVGFMFSNNTSLMTEILRWPELYFRDPRGLHLNLADPVLWPRFLHVVLGAVAVAGLGLVWWGRQRRDATGLCMERFGARAFVWVTAANLVMGTLYLMSLERPTRKLFMGGDAWATILLTVGLVTGTALAVMGRHLLKTPSPTGLWPVTGTTIVTLGVMIVMRDLARSGELAAWYRPGDFAVAPQWGNLALFGVLLVGGVITLAWMLRRLHGAWHR